VRSPLIRVAQLSDVPLFPVLCRPVASHLDPRSFTGVNHVVARKGALGSLGSDRVSPEVLSRNRKGIDIVQTFSAGNIDRPAAAETAGRS